MKSSKERILDLAATTSFIHARDLKAINVNYEYLRRLTAEGVLEKVGRGLFTPTMASGTENYSLAQAAKAVPRGVICLLSALRFHNIGTQLPWDIWMGIEQGSRVPRVSHLKLRVHRFGGASFTEGRELHMLEGVPTQVFSPAKTVADCFKFRNQIGMEAVIEALRETLRCKKATVHDIWKYAEINRVANVMLPYLQAIV